MENGAGSLGQWGGGGAGGMRRRAALPPSLVQSWVSLEECAAPCSNALDTGVPLSHPGAQQEQQLSFTVSSFLTRLSLFAFPAVGVCADIGLASKFF